MSLSILPIGAAICLGFSIWFFFARHQYKAGILLLCAGGLLLRLYMAFVDPFLHDWDERFHALVAKNMMEYPFKPMLRVFPILPYDYTAWCCNHIWVHKQPLFLWQMALSMKAFGVHEWAIRLPSALLSAAMTYWVYRIALIWTKDHGAAYIAGALSAFSYYQLELTSGLLSLDHNDLVFTAYVTAGIWALYEYTERPGFRWALVAGVLVGLAILVKWLTALVLFGGAGLCILSNRRDWLNWAAYKHWLAAFALSLGIMAPWQWYILKAFPKESAWEYEYNFKHIEERLGAHTTHNPWFYVEHLEMQFNTNLLPFLLLGTLVVFFGKSIQRRHTLPMLGMMAVVFAFFSIVVETKMGAYNYVVCSGIFCLIGLGLERAIQSVSGSAAERFHLLIRALVIVLAALLALKPWQIQQNHSGSNAERLAKINNTQVFKNLNKEVPPDYVVFNCKSFEDTELMFYQKNNAYHWFPPEKQLDSLLNAGYKIAAFQSHTNQGLPEYFGQKSGVLIINQTMK